MDLSIVILNYKQKGLVKQCIKGIVASRPNIDYELIVVDNDSNDDCLEMVKIIFKNEILAEKQQKLPLDNPLKIPPILTIQAKSNDGFAAGNNLGIKAAKGKYIMIINPDIAVVPDALEKMIDFMDKDESIGMIGPKLINPDGSVQYSCRRFPNLFTPIYRRTIFGKLLFAKKYLVSYLMIDYDHESTVKVDWLFGACLLIRKSVLDKVGMFDERFFMYFEDLDLCRRFWSEGYKVIYFTEVEMVHYHQRLSAAKNGIWGIFSKGGRIHLASGIKYFAKYLGAKIPKTD